MEYYTPEAIEKYKEKEKNKKKANKKKRIIWESKGEIELWKNEYKNQFHFFLWLFSQ